MNFQINRLSNFQIKQIMNSSVKNSVRIIGNLGKDPEIKIFGKSGSDQKLAKFSIATTEVYTNKKGEKVEDTQWHNIIVWGKLAGIVEKYMTKGSKIALEGKLTNRSYEDKSGNKKYITEITANDIHMLSKKVSEQNV